MKYSIALLSKQIVNTDHLKNDQNEFKNDWEHKLILKPIKSDDDSEEETDEDDDDNESYDEYDESVIEFDEYANRVCLIYGFNDGKFEPPTEVFYTLEDAENEFMKCVKGIQHISEEYMIAERTIRNMIEVKKSETVITMYEYTSSGYEIPDRGYRWVMKILRKDIDY
jgi:hypothetical protein